MRHIMETGILQFASLSGLLAVFSAIGLTGPFGPAMSLACALLAVAMAVAHSFMENLPVGAFLLYLCHGAASSAICLLLVAFGFVEADAAGLCSLVAAAFGSCAVVGGGLHVFGRVDEEQINGALSPWKKEDT